MAHLKVIIRVRPFSQREKEDGCKHVVEIQNNETVAITNIKVSEEKSGDSRERLRRFTFDYCFPENATQNDIFDKVETILSEAMKKRYDSCVLAYGQSATGKTHTMMGYPDDAGLTPRLSQKLPEYVYDTVVSNEIDNMQTTISYLEVYNEKVRDLLRPEYEDEKHPNILRIREHPKKGPYVQGLSEHQVDNRKELLHWIQLGSENRRVASTLRNPRSSRSHSVVTITCDGVRLYLVDLAGSERTGSKVLAASRIREGASINKSLVALGNVISALAEPPIRQKTNRKRFVPYRDSVLTWLLKDTLGGSSNTILIATISPASKCYSETVNTLRFGQRAKLIISNPIVHEDPKEKIIHELRLEIAKLRRELKESKENPSIFMSQRHDILENLNGGSPKLCDSLISDSEEPSTSETDSIPPINNNLKSSLEPLNKTEKISSDHSVLQTKTEKLIFAMNVETSLNPEKRQIPKLRRTSSVNSVGLVNRSRTPSFGSRESLPTLERPNGERSKVLGTHSELTTSNILTRRRSVDKSSNVAKRVVPEKSKRYLEKSVETEGAGIPAKSKAVRQRKIPPTRKSNIIANVTRRLYAKTKNSETDMEGFEEPKDDIPKELTICSNARIRLKELTQKAIRAHRFKQVETQTDTIVLRVKEISTDVQDLRLQTLEVRDAETITIADTKDESVGCSMFDNFKKFETNNLMKISKSIGIQCDSFPLKENNENSPRKQYSPPILSFTKYLENKDLPYQKSIICSNPSNSSQIHGYFMGINITNPIANERRSENSPSDSLEDQNICSLSFPTPDLISNHNSLEEPSKSERLRVKFAQSNSENIHFDFLEFPENSKPLHASNDTVGKSTPNFLYDTLYPVVCSCDVLFECDSLPSFEMELAKASRSIVGDKVLCETLTVYKPIVSKQPFKPTPKPSGLIKENSIDTLESGLSQDITNSLENHRDQITTPSTKNKERILSTMSVFLEEATKLMTNLAKAAEKLETSNDSSTKDFNLHITIDNVDNVEELFRSEKNGSGFSAESQTDCVSYEVSSQTPSLAVESHSTQYDNFDMPLNEIAPILEDRCKKLELNSNGRIASRRLRTFQSSATPSVQSYGPSIAGVSELNRDLSLDSYNSSFSDYGSLRQSNHRRHISRCSPSALLKELSHMRRHVMRASKECLLDIDISRNQEM